MQTRTTGRRHLALVIMASITRTEIISGGETAEKREPQYTVGGNINWCGPSGTQYGGSSKKRKIELPYDPAVLLLSIYLKKTKTFI